MPKKKIEYPRQFNEIPDYKYDLQFTPEGGKGKLFQESVEDGYFVPPFDVFDTTFALEIVRELPELQRKMRKYCRKAPPWTPDKELRHKCLISDYFDWSETPEGDQFWRKRCPYLYVVAYKKEKKMVKNGV